MWNSLATRNIQVRLIDETIVCSINLKGRHLNTIERKRTLMVKITMATSKSRPAFICSACLQGPKQLLWELLDWYLEYVIVWEWSNELTASDSSKPHNSQGPWDSWSARPCQPENEDRNNSTRLELRLSFYRLLNWTDYAMHLPTHNVTILVVSYMSGRE